MAWGNRGSYRSRHGYRTGGVSRRSNYQAWDYYQYLEVPSCMNTSMAKFRGASFILDATRMDAPMTQTFKQLSKAGYTVKYLEKGDLKNDCKGKVLVTSNFKKARNPKLVERVYKAKKLLVVYWKDLAEYMVALNKASGNVRNTLYDTALNYAKSPLAGLTFGVINYYSVYPDEKKIATILKANGAKLSKSNTSKKDYMVLNGHNIIDPAAYANLEKQFREIHKGSEIVNGVAGIEAMINMRKNISLIESL